MGLGSSPRAAIGTNDEREQGEAEGQARVLCKRVAQASAIREGDQLDEAQMATWVKQAAASPGWVP